MFRLLQINFAKYEELYPIHEWEYENFHQIHKRKIQIVYTLSNKFQIILFGFGAKKKWSTTSILEINNIFKLIDEMPMRNIVQESTSSSKLENLITDSWA